MSDYYRRGDYNAICDICGFKFKASEMRKDWRGLYVCLDDLDKRNEQDFLRGRVEKQTVPWARTEPDDTTVAVCYIWGASGYSGLAVAGCMVAGQDTYTGLFLQQSRDSGEI